MKKLLLVTALASIVAQCDQNDFRSARERMVQQIVEFGVRDTATLRALRAVPRHEFVPPQWRLEAYADRPLPIGSGQTISQPYIVALMTELLTPRAGMRILEVGTGSGYQAAVLAEIVDSVYSIELLPELATSSADRLKRLGYRNVVVRQGDGYQGWPDRSPFDGILVTAAADEIPSALVAQLKVGGLMVIPVDSGVFAQELTVVTKKIDGTIIRAVLPVRFVPLVHPR